MLWGVLDFWQFIGQCVACFFCSSQTTFLTFLLIFLIYWAINSCEELKEKSSSHLLLLQFTYKYLCCYSLHVELRNWESKLCLLKLCSSTTFSKSWNFKRFAGNFLIQIMTLTILLGKIGFVTDTTATTVLVDWSLLINVKIEMKARAGFMTWLPLINTELHCVWCMSGGCFFIPSVFLSMRDEREE